METEKYDQTTTIAITLHVKEKLEARKILRNETWNSVIQRLLEEVDKK